MYVDCSQPMLTSKEGARILIGRSRYLVLLLNDADGCECIHAPDPDIANPDIAKCIRVYRVDGKDCDDIVHEHNVVKSWTVALTHAVADLEQIHDEGPNTPSYSFASSRCVCVFSCFMSAPLIRRTAVDTEFAQKARRRLTTSLQGRRVLNRRPGGMGLQQSALASFIHVSDWLAIGMYPLEMDRYDPACAVDRLTLLSLSLSLSLSVCLSVCLSVSLSLSLSLSLTQYIFVRSVYIYIYSVM